jgi:hypothetical protein
VWYAFLTEPARRHEAAIRNVNLNHQHHKHDTSRVIKQKKISRI